MPGTSSSACSIGRVTVSIIVRAGQRAAVADDHDAREDQRRIDVARKLKCGQQPRRREDDGHGDDCAAVAIRRATRGSFRFRDVGAVRQALLPLHDHVLARPSARW